MPKMTKRRALEIVLELAEGNRLNRDDPDVQSDEALKESADLQADACAIVFDVLAAL